jgi:hypothetical protein
MWFGISWKKKEKNQQNFFLPFTHKLNAVYGACSTHGRYSKCIYNFNLKLEWNRPLGRSSRRHEGTIKWALKILGVTAWTGLMWLRAGISWEL